MNKLAIIRAVIDYIETNLTEKLDLDQIAGAVHYSKHYLHRTFSEMLGCTIHEYVQRRQLTEAAKLLVFSDRSILEVAMLAGYESQQAFTTIFTAMYKQTPYQYRLGEKYYPLQLKYQFDEGYTMCMQKEQFQWQIEFATKEDISRWMDLVWLVIDGFPHLEEQQYRQVLQDKIDVQQALILREGDLAIGILLFSGQTGSIDFMGVHPLYRKRGIPQAFLTKVMEEVYKEQQVSITTYRQGDKADKGHREELLALGFAEAELLMEYGYPTQRFVLSKGVSADGAEEGIRNN